MFSPVNPKTDAQECDRITVGAILWLDDDETRAGATILRTASTDRVTEDDVGDVRRTLPIAHGRAFGLVNGERQKWLSGKIGQPNAVLVQ